MDGGFTLDSSGGEGAVGQGAHEEGPCGAGLGAVVGAGFSEGLDVGGEDSSKVVTETNNFLVS